MNATTLQVIWQRLQDGGVYMYPIFLLSVAMFSLIAHHLLAYRALKRAVGMPGGEAISGGDANPLSELFRWYSQSRCAVPELNVRLREELVRNFLSHSGAEGKAILLCGSTAMLLGLLGTVSGMINTFEAIQLFGVGNTKSFAAGISEALLTTQSGLLVGVAGLAAGHIMKRMHNKVRLKLYRRFDELERSACGEENHG